MKLYKRVIEGAEAGLLAGVGVVLVFLVGDVLRLAPAETPTLLAAELFGVRVDGAESGLISATVEMAVTGFRVVAYTVLHFCAFALVGVAGAFVLSTGSLGASVVGGALYGGTACSAIFYGCRWIVRDAPVVLQGVAPSAVILANCLAGAVIGSALYLARRPQPSAKAEVGAQA